MRSGRVLCSLFLARPCAIHGSWRVFPPVAYVVVTDWVFDSVSGYMYNARTGYYHDPETMLYFSDTVGQCPKPCHASACSFDSAHPTLPASVWLTEVLPLASDLPFVRRVSDSLGLGVQVAG